LFGEGVDFVALLLDAGGGVVD